MDARIMKLTFLSPVHFGEGRLSGGRLTCDAATLFSALFIEALHMGCSEELLLAVKSGELYFSDAFPYIADELYLPKPHFGVSPDDGDVRGLWVSGDSRAKKAFKKLKYIRQERLSAFLDGTMDAVAELQAFSLGASSLQMKVNLAYENSEDAEPYSVGSYSFNDDCGIYFILCGSYDIGPLMESLQYSGLGGKRTSGYGRFCYSIEDACGLSAFLRISNDSLLSEPAMYMLLSSAVPSEYELTDELLAGARTKVVKKGGFVQSSSYAFSPQKKRNSFVFSPGSMFARTFDGEVLDVGMKSGAHPVYRYAKAMWMEVR